MNKAIIFDLDGVLVSTDKLHYKAWKAIADQENIYFDEEINNRLRGVSRMASLEIILERGNREYSQEEKEKLAEAKNEIYKESLKELSPSDLFDHAVETITALKEKGIKVAIGSSSKNTRTILRQLGIGDVFDAISDGNNITHSKPHPEVFLKAAEFLGLEPENCTVVEDAYAGIDAAKAAGMTAVGIGDATNYKKCDHTISDLYELIKIMEEN